MKRVLILGAAGYIGTSFQTYMGREYAEECTIDRVSLRGDGWRDMDWSVYDSVLNATGKAHADTGALSEEEKQEYYQVNCELACQAYRKAIADKAGQYIYLSSIIVYGDSSTRRGSVILTEETKPSPSSFYGDSKWEAEKRLMRMSETEGGATGRPMPPAGPRGRTRLAVVRLPMVYGKGCRGNYRTLAKIAKRTRVFPGYKNERSMIYIENLCEFLRLLIQQGDGGTFFPQNREYVQTSEMVRLIGERHMRRILCPGILAPLVSVGKCMPGRIGSAMRKAFGDLVYAPALSGYQRGAYQRYSLRESIARTEDSAEGDTVSGQR